MKYCCTTTIPDANQGLLKRLEKYLIDQGWTIEREVMYSRYWPVIMRRWRADYVVSRQDGEEVAVIEIQGGLWNGGRHTRGKGYEDDLRKSNTVQRLGGKWYAYTYDMIESGEYEVDLT